MTEKEQILKLFNKYGFDSLKREPFLYADKEKVGIYYTVKHPIYGNLNRVYFPSHLIDAENFLQNYYLYKKKNKEIYFNDYESLTAIPEFKKVEAPKVSIIKKEPTYSKREKHCALLLISILKEKMNIEKTTLENVNKLKQLEKEALEEFSVEKNKEKKVKLKEDIIINPEIDNSSFFQALEKEVEEIETKEEMYAFIIKILDFIKKREQNEEFIENKYNLIKLPIEIEVLKEQINWLKENKKKRKLFTKKSDIEKSLKDIENRSNINKIVSLESFCKNEQKRIMEKYEMISEIEYGSIADYLIEFDNLKIKEQKIVEKKEEPKIIKKTLEQLIEELNDQYNEISEEEKSKIQLTSSFLRLIWQEENENKQKAEAKELLSIINNPNNILAKIKLFKTMDTKKTDVFISELNELLVSLKKEKSFSITEPITLYMQDELDSVCHPFLVASSNKSIMPLKSRLKTPTTYILKLQPNSSFYYTKEELCIDYENEESLVLRKNRPLFLIDTEKNILINTNSDIIKVARCEINWENVNNKIIVTKIKQSKIDYYKEVMIERKR